MARFCFNNQGRIGVQTHEVRLSARSLRAVRGMLGDSRKTEVSNYLPAVGEGVLARREGSGGGPSALAAGAATASQNAEVALLCLERLVLLVRAERGGSRACGVGGRCLGSRSPGLCAQAAALSCAQSAGIPCGTHHTLPAAVRKSLLAVSLTACRQACACFACGDVLTGVKRIMGL